MALIMVPKIIFIRKHAHDPREKEDDEKDTAELELPCINLLKWLLNDHICSKMDIQKVFWNCHFKGI